ncbi:MAG TPA: enoyl-CoA hydratase-related protein [Gemmatimonadales bacterium]|nr:enoyl-CoA hydratase-related protein [Gemmatimonadales bacterium]
MPATANSVRYARTGGIGRLVLDRPPVNVLNLAAMEALQSAIAEAAADAGLKVLAVSGAGRAFSAGVDVADHTADRVGRMLALFHGAVRQLMALEVPVVGLVHGAALGGGCELAMACDMVLARDDLKLGQPEIQLAVFPPVAAALLPQLIGRQRALDLILTGRTIGAAEALRMGLVSRVLSTAEFEAGTDAALAELASRSGPALRLAKRAVLEGMGLPFGPALQQAEDLYLNELMELADVHEGLAAFMEKRAPVWEDPA